MLRKVIEFLQDTEEREDLASYVSTMLTMPEPQPKYIKNMRNFLNIFEDTLEKETRIGDIMKDRIRTNMEVVSLYMLSYLGKSDVFAKENIKGLKTVMEIYDAYHRRDIFKIPDMEAYLSQAISKPNVGEIEHLHSTGVEYEIKTYFSDYTFVNPGDSNVKKYNAVQEIDDDDDELLELFEEIGDFYLCKSWKIVDSKINIDGVNGWREYQNYKKVGNFLVAGKHVVRA